ncbi:class I poly(R)-hydroxyalkanoic acid synthase [Bauldia sp.]|uniref:class I poly(R)-hydroxyalkanoic acid synthase n=1 Tax=Bauldia sp. TaxID=2575872 RepID=UPI0025B98B32|nr:class I poly(R)-hydroxyalkanoic acid synthase [Bauldia sp.]
MTTEKPSNDSYGIRDPEAFAHNLARIMEEAGKAASAYLKPREEGKASFDFVDSAGEFTKTLSRVAEYWLSDPERTVEAESSLVARYIDLWTGSLKRMMGESTGPTAEPEPGDKRFVDPQWSENQFFDFLKQFYLITSRWAIDLVDQTDDDMDPHTKLKAGFYMRQIANALAPSNFVMTNPELLRETLSSNAENLVRGMHMLAEDIEAGHGDLKIRQSSKGDFKLGENIANTPGKVIHQNSLCQVIQYAPTTDTVLKRPLVIVPPWINKFYILDLNPDKSFIRWCVDQGHTVFVISWVNPGKEHARKNFGDYMRDGVIEAVDVAMKVTGADGVNAVGYCVGGTMLAVTLAWMAAKKDDRIKSATFFATQVDFTHSGDLKVFVDEEQIADLEYKMKMRGYLEGRKMASAFNMLRSNDLIWPYVIANYMKGKEPSPFDLLYWNSDATRMPAANHAFYLRNCYLKNRLSAGEMEVAGVTLDLARSKVPIYNLATREDHIAPPRSVFYGSSFFGGKVTFVLTGSGHIAGVINPPSRNKYQYWTGPAPRGDRYDEWAEKAKEHPGSWWPHWQAWIEAKNKTRVKPPKMGGGRFKSIEDAPGSYVRVKA